MATQDLVLPTRSSATVLCDDLVDLAAILDPDVHIAIWRRPSNARIANLLERHGRTFEQPWRNIARAAELHQAAELAGLVPAAARAADPIAAAELTTDVAMLCEMFSELLCAEDVLVSLESPDEATCPRFHVDRVGVRMLVTYVGPGTEWLPHDQVDRQWLGSAGHGRVDEETGLMRAGAEVQRVSPFDVVLLKGEAWPGAENFGAVHRSPDPGEQRRMMLRVDMLRQQPVLDAEKLS